MKPAIKPGDEKFSPPDDEAAEDDAEDGGLDSLLGNAFDAFQDGDREGFVRSMRAAVVSAKE